MIKSFLGCDREYEEALVVLFGAGYDATTSNKPGARFAPAAIRAESYGLESYSPYLDRDLEIDARVHDAGDLELYGRQEGVLAEIEKMAGKILDDGKLPFMIGGEHLVTLGSVRAAAKKYPDLHIVHFDAHTDLRDDYLGEKLSHATVLRRCYDILGNNRISQFGIRSGTKEEFDFAKKHLDFNPFSLENISKVLSLGNTPIYLTIDLDILDPSAFPGTGTPEAGGVSFLELINSFKILSQLNIVAIDIVELAPNYDISAVSTATACKIIRELLLYVGKRGN